MTETRIRFYIGLFGFIAMTVGLSMVNAWLVVAAGGAGITALCWLGLGDE